ncbi:MAG: molybdopterin molybdotransferase MoeA [Sphingomonadales bacterium]|nr:molybdopterin molybdotransferase MoeA [Sphingomonadales bacterium]
MVSFEQAQDIIAQVTEPLASERVSLLLATGRVLAESLTAQTDSPRQPVSAMDGYAVLDRSTSLGCRLNVIGEACAGKAFEASVGASEAVRIFTGAPLPRGADRVIMQEKIDRNGDAIIIAHDYGPGWHVRGTGSDFRAGELLLAATRLSDRAMVAAAAADQAELCVTRRARVAIIATGDELAPPGEARLRPDAIPESVSHGIAAMVEAAGGEIGLRSCGADDLDALQAIAGEALGRADLVVVTGGASVGDRDFAKPMFAPFGLSLHFKKVAMKPGKPVWFGAASGKLVLGLPGNPTSAMVTGRLFLVPLLARLMRQSCPDVLHWRSLPLARPLGNSSDRETFVRARWDNDGLVPLDNQDSGSQLALRDADWLIRIASGAAMPGPGTMVPAVAF